MIKLKKILIENVNVLKTLRGTPIKRYKNNVGKHFGTQIYVHKQYASEVVPSELLTAAANTLKKSNPSFKYNSIMFDAKAKIIRFDEAPDFDSAREPHVGNYIIINPDQSIRAGRSNNIWHHKWLWVKDNYRGFDVNKSKEWSRLWLSKLPEVAKGTDDSWNKQLHSHGIGNV